VIVAFDMPAHEGADMPGMEAFHSSVMESAIS
jgi:hypothetical protein